MSSDSTTYRTTFTSRLRSVELNRSWLKVLGAGGLFLLFFAVMAWLQFSTPDMPDNDGYYHIKMAYLMRTQGLTPDFPWLPLTILNPREFYDHHFLFHVALIPFTFGDLRLGAKWASVFFASLSFLTVWWFLNRQRVPYAFLWSLGLLAVSEAFLYRMSITRAQSLSLAVLVLGLHCLLNGKYGRLSLLAFFYVWLYDAFPLLLLVAFLHAIAVWLVERRLELRPLVFVAAGTALGLLVNPYFPYNIVFAYRHILPKLFEATEVSVGNEWYPYSTGQLLENSPLSLAAFLAGALALGLKGERMDVRTATSFLAASLFGLMLFQARRFVEYYPAFALIFAALAWTPIIERNRSVTSQPGGEMTESTGVQRRFQLRGRSWSELGKAWLPFLMIAAFIVVGTLGSLSGTRDNLQGAKPYDLFAGASAWLQANTSAGERVFQTDWDDFPRLFFYNSDNTYIVGLDPTYLQLYNPAVYNRWVQITRGDVDQPSQAILDEFAARYVVSDLNHGDFIRRANDDPAMREVYSDDGSIVFEIVE
jgi:hypothetical protein